MEAQVTPPLPRAAGRPAAPARCAVVCIVPQLGAPLNCSAGDCAGAARQVCSPERARAHSESCF